MAVDVAGILLSLLAEGQRKNQRDEDENIPTGDRSLLAGQNKSTIVVVTVFFRRRLAVDRENHVRYANTSTRFCY